MAKELIKRGLTSKTAKIFIGDSSVSNGAGLTGLAFNSAGLTAYYIREGDAAATAITLVTATVGTWASGGFKEVDAVNMPGFYEVGIPNAALASGASVVLLYKGATNMVPVPLEYELTGPDLQDGTAFGLSRLDAAVSSVAASVWAVATRTLTAFGFGVTASTVSDKTGYGLAAGEHTAIATDAQTGLTAQGYTTVRAPKLDSLDAAVSSRLATSGYTAPDTGATIAGDVLSATAASYNTAGTIGAKINAAGTASDPWATALPGAYGAGTAGNIIGNLLTNVPAAVWNALTSGLTAVGSIGKLLATISFTGANVNANAQVVADKAGYTAATVQDKTGYVLSAAGLDTVATTDVASDTDGRSTLPKQVRYLLDRLVNKGTETAPVGATPGVLTVYNDAGTAISTAQITDDGTTFTKAKQA